MPSPKKSAKAAKTRVIRKRMADGTVKEYTYGPRRKVRAKAKAGDTMEDLVRDFERSEEYSNLAKVTQVTYEIYMRPWAKVGHLAVKSIRRKHVLAIRDSISSERGKGAATGFVRVAGAMFSWAVEREMIDQSPVHKIKRLPQGHFAAWSEDDLSRALKALPLAYQRVMILGVHTGQRRGDLITLTWGAWDGYAIRLKQSKTGVELVIPASVELRQALTAWKFEAQAADIATTTILSAPSGRPWTPAHLTREMGKKLRVIGIEKNVHGLRKLAATRLADAGCSTSEIQSILGWKTLQMAELYTRTKDQEKLAGAAIHRLEVSRIQTAKTKQKT